MKGGDDFGHKVWLRPILEISGRKFGQKFLSAQKSSAIYAFLAYPPPPLNFFGIRFWKKILFFLFKLRTYVFGIYIIFFAYYPTYRDILQKPAYEGAKKCIF